MMVQQKVATGTSSNTFQLDNIVTGYYFVVLTGSGYEKAEKVFLSSEK